jgi:hypothetical protein
MESKMSGLELSSKTAARVRHRMQRAHDTLIQRAFATASPAAKVELRRQAKICAAIRADMEDSPESQGAMHDGVSAIETLVRETWPEGVQELVDGAIDVIRKDWTPKRG